MNTRIVVAAVIGLGIVAAAVGSILYYTRNNAVGITGEVLKVRTHPIDAESTVVVIDLRLRNPSTQQFVVREVEVALDPASGAPPESMLFSEMDARRLFTYYPVLGQKYNQSLIIRDKLNPGQTLDRMIAVKFSAPESRVDNRKALRITVHDVDRFQSEIVEDRGAGKR